MLPTKASTLLRAARTNLLLQDQKKTRRKRIKPTPDEEETGTRRRNVCVRLLWGIFEVLTSNWLNILLATIPFSLLAYIFHWDGTPTFILAMLSLVPLSWQMKFAISQMRKTVPHVVEKVLTLIFDDKIIEMSIGSCLLLQSKRVADVTHAQGLLDVLQAFVLGSVLSKVALVMGLCLIAGGMKHTVLQFNSASVKKNITLLIISLGLISIPFAFWFGTSQYTQTSHESVLRLSRYSAIFLLVSYCFYVLFRTKTHERYFKHIANYESPVLSGVGSIILLVVILTLIILESMLLVGAVSVVTDPALSLAKQGWGEKYTFIGIILLPLASQGGEYLVTIKTAMMNEMGQVVCLLLRSCTELVLLIFPMLIILGWLLQVELTCIFLIFPLVCVFGAVLILKMIIFNGEATWYEGVLLVIGYSILIAAFFFSSIC